MSYGMKSHLGLSVQSSFGTETTAYEYFPIISETVTDNIEDLVEEGMKSTFYEGQSHEGLLTIAGDIVFEPHPVLVGHFLRAVTGQASGTLVDSVTTHEFLPKQSDFTPQKCALPPYTMEIFRDTTNGFVFRDTIVNQLVLEFTSNAIVRATASVMCVVSSLDTATTPSFPEGDPWRWNQASLSIGGTADGTLENGTITFGNNIEGVVTMNGTKLVNKFMRSTWMNIGMTGTFCVPDEAKYNKFRSPDSNQERLLLNISGDTITGSQTNDLLIDLPQFRYTNYPINMGGAGRIAVGFEGKGKQDVSSSYGIKYTLTNTKAAY